MGDPFLYLCILNRGPQDVSETRIVCGHIQSFTEHIVRVATKLVFKHCYALGPYAIHSTPFAQGTFNEFTCRTDNEIRQLQQC